VKWEIPEVARQPGASSERYWTSEHRDNDYMNVISLTDDEGVRDRITESLAACKATRVLVPGAGSRTSLEEHLVSHLPDLDRLTCTDFHDVIELARAAFPHDAVEYRAADSTDLPWQDEFDAAVVVNSILSGSDRENRRMLSSIHRALHPGGLLLGFFPTVFASLDIALISNDEERRATIDLERSTKYEPAQDDHQIFYTPLRLRMILREAGFEIVSMEVYFLISDHFRSEDGEWSEFTIEDEDLAIYEHYVLARAI
jgi:SAM-dependent methyltransferase